MPPDVLGEDETGTISDAELQRWTALARDVLVAEGVVGPAELSVTFVGRDEIAALNETWMDETGPTDVLSFPIDAPGISDGAPEIAGQMRLLGDIVICSEVAGTYAVDNGRSLEDELALLVVHGVLHVLGLDHAEPEDEAIMTAREDLHLRAFHKPSWTRSAS